MDAKTKQRIEEIRKRLEEYRKYRKHYNAYAYFSDFDAQTKTDLALLHKAIDDIEFLFNEIRRFRVLETLRYSPSRISEK